MNLAVEYAKRKGLTFLWCINESVVFFDHSSYPVICCISSPSRSISTCSYCGTAFAANKLILEIIYPATEALVSTHKHIQPDGDIFIDLNDMGISSSNGYKPFAAKSNMDIDLWLWRKYFSLGQVKPAIKLVETKSEIEQMVFCSAKNPGYYKLFYSFYQMIAMGRTYLLNGV